MTASFHALERVRYPARALRVEGWEPLLVTTRRLVALLGRNVAIERVEEQGIDVVARPVVRTDGDHDGVIGRRPRDDHPVVGVEMAAAKLVEHDAG